MWFKNRRKNRRLEPEYVLDVRLSTKAASREKLRLIATGLSLLTGMVVVCFILWKTGEAGLNALVYENRSFSIEQIDVSTDGILSIEHIRRWSLVREGENLLGLDLMRVKRDLELVPFVKQAAVERVLPRKLRIRITEREPVAKVFAMQNAPHGKVEQKVWYLDEEGWVMPPFDIFAEASNLATNGEGLTIISGVNAGELRSGRQSDSLQLRAALDLLDQFDRAPISSLVEVARVDIATPDTLRVITPQGTEVIFGLKDFPQQLNRWHLVHDHFRGLDKSVLALDLSVSNNSPVRLAEAAFVPKTQLKPAKQSRFKRKNV